MRIELLNGKDKENRMRTVATAGKLSRTKGNVFDVLESCDDYEKNLKLINRIIGMGHKSIIEHDYFVFALCDVSPIIEQTVIGYRLTSFTIKSGREVDFRSVGYYVPEFRNKDGKVKKNNKELQKKYCKHMDFLFKEYGKFVDAGVKEEDARFVLPYSFHTNIVMGLDGRELEKMIKDFLYGKKSRIQEVKELGTYLFDIVKEYAPYLVKGIEETKDYSEDLFENYYINKNIVPYPKARMVHYTENADEVILRSVLQYRNQCKVEELDAIEKKLEKKNPEWKKDVFDKLKVSEDQREFEQVQFGFEIPISLIILKHLTRHRMHSLLVPDFVPMWNLRNYQTPPSVKKVDEKRFKEIQEKNAKVYEEFKAEKIMEEDLIYFYLCGQFVNVMTTMNGRTLEWISRLRCCTKAHWEIRAIARDMVKEVKEVAPLFGDCLGSTCDVFGTCPEGKESCGRVNAKK